MKMQDSPNYLSHIIWPAIVYNIYPSMEYKSH